MIATLALAGALSIARPAGVCTDLVTSVGCDALTRWVPFALVIAAALIAVLAYGSRVRHQLLFVAWLAVPFTAALALWTANRALIGLPLILLVFGIAAFGVSELRAAITLRSDRAIGILLGATTLAAALALLPWVQAVQPTASDEPHYLITMQSLLRDGDLDLRNQYDDAATYADFYPPPLVERHVVGVGNAQYPIRDPGLPFLAAPAFALARRTGVLVLMCVAAALFAWRGYAFLRRLEFRQTTALLAVSAVVFLHPFFTYTTQVYPDLFGALAVLVAAELIDRPTPGRIAAASALVGALPLLSARLWFPAVGLGVVVAWWAIAPLLRGRGRDSALRVAAGALPFALLIAAYCVLDWRLFGIALPNAGYLVIRDQQTVLVYTPHLGITGIFLDRTFGLLSHTPLYALAFAGIVPLARRGRARRSLGLVALTLAYLLYLAYIGDIAAWSADGAPSSRYQLATLALPMCALAAGLDLVRCAIARVLAVVAFGWSAAVVFVYALAPNLRYDLVVDVAATGGPGQLWEAVARALRFDPGLMFPSLVRASTQDAVVAAAWMVALTAIAWSGWRQSDRALVRSPSGR